MSIQSCLFNPIVKIFKYFFFSPASSLQMGGNDNPHSYTFSKCLFVLSGRFLLMSKKLKQGHPPTTANHFLDSKEATKNDFAPLT